MAELTSLKNIGKEMERKLKAVEINSAEELKQIGSEEAFFRLKNAIPKFVWYTFMLFKVQLMILNSINCQKK